MENYPLLLRLLASISLRIPWELRLAKKQGDASIVSCSRSASAVALLGCAKGSISAYTILVPRLKLDE
jgi:hypothetical protein